MLDECQTLPLKLETLLHRCRRLHGDTSRRESAPEALLPLPATSVTGHSTFKVSVAFCKSKTKAVVACVCRWDWEEMKVRVDTVFGLCKGQKASRMRILEENTAQNFFLPQHNHCVSDIVVTRLNCVCFPPKII